MTTITITIDETQQTQVIWCQQLNVYLRVYSLQQTDLQNEMNGYVTQVQSLQNNIQTLSGLIQLSAPVIPPPT